MLSVFKINDPYKVIIVFLIALIIELPIFISGINITIPEIEWQTLGNKLASGGALYVDVYYPVGPLSAQVYRLLSYLLPDNYLVYRILGMLLVIIQAVILNFSLIRYKAYNQNTYVPSLIYVVLLLGMEDYITLSPQLMGLTFVILAANTTFKLIEGRRRIDEDYLKIGLFTGFSVLFYPLYLFFLFPVIIALLFFTNTIIRRYLLLLTGFFLPLVLTWMKFLWYGQLDSLYFNLDYLILSGNDIALLHWKSLIFVLIVPFLFLVYSFLKVLQSMSFINYQVRLQKYYFLYVAFGILIVIFDYHQSSHILVVFVPVMTFFIAHLFLMIRKTMVAELLFISMFLLIVLLNYTVSFEWVRQSEVINFSNQYLKRDSLQIEPAGEKILVTGMDTRKYYGNRLGTPYLSWVMFMDQIEGLNSYDNIVQVYENFNEDLPELIYDEYSVMPALLTRIPELSIKYHENGDQTYQLTSGSP